ncbi:MAG: hypothetical protein LBR56_05535 [Sporomusaceae bacterium]|nr:hypothetical protein [Sporomusaceae bacterium]
MWGQRPGQLSNSFYNKTNLLRVAFLGGKLFLEKSFPPKPLSKNILNATYSLKKLLTQEKTQKQILAEKDIGKYYKFKTKNL